MFPFFKKKKTQEELYLEDLERRKRETGAAPKSGESVFEMTVEDVFSISGRGTVVTGRVSRGTVSQGDRVLIRSHGGQMLETRIGGIESFRKARRSAAEGDVVGLLLKGVQKDQVEPGDVLTGT